jgi:hypothetical protein
LEEFVRLQGKTSAPESKFLSISSIIECLRIKNGSLLEKTLSSFPLCKIKTNGFEDKKMFKFQKLGKASAKGFFLDELKHPTL